MTGFFEQLAYMVAGLTIFAAVVIAITRYDRNRRKKEPKLADMPEMPAGSLTLEKLYGYALEYHLQTTTGLRKAHTEYSLALNLLNSEEGLQVETKTTRVFSLLTGASQAGLPQAQALLASLYSMPGQMHDDAQAFWWWYFAAEQGIPEAQAALSNCYAKGQGTISDEVEAYKWLRLSALASDDSWPSSVNSADIKADLWDASNHVRSRLTPEQQSRADTWVLCWQRKSWLDLQNAAQVPNGTEVPHPVPREPGQEGPEGQPITCTYCGLINEPTASTCDCGYPLG